MGIHQADLDAGMAELVKDLKPSGALTEQELRQHELAMAEEARHYKKTTVAHQYRRRFWMLVGSMIMVAVGIWLR
jgi:hypothetical protein